MKKKDHDIFIVRETNVLPSSIHDNAKLGTAGSHHIQNLETLLLVIGLCHPKAFRSTLHDLAQYSTTQEHHMTTSRRIFNADFEFLHARTHIIRG